MAKRCLICDAEAAYCIKGSSECYCEGCAIDQFGDITVLVKVEEEARKLKDLIKRQGVTSDMDDQQGE